MVLRPPAPPTNQALIIGTLHRERQPFYVIKTPIYYQWDAHPSQVTPARNLGHT